MGILSRDGRPEELIARYIQTGTGNFVDIAGINPDVYLAVRGADQEPLP
jgi:hypothetical protein